MLVSPLKESGSAAVYEFPSINPVPSTHSYIICEIFYTLDTTIDIQGDFCNVRSNPRLKLFSSRYFQELIIKGLVNV